MSKRRLSEQQRRRIEAAEERHRSGAIANGEEGLVIARFGRRVLVETAPDVRISATLRRRVQDPVAGDRVVLLRDGAQAVIEALLPRRTCLLYTSPSPRD